MASLCKETQRHSTAFAYYLQLIGKRSYAEVARKFGVSETSVRKWAQSFSWEQRVREADEKASATADPSLRSGRQCVWEGEVCGPRVAGHVIDSPLAG